MDSGVLLYVKMVEVDPSMMPASNAINSVPAPTPLLFIWDKSSSNNILPRVNKYIVSTNDLWDGGF